MARGNPLSTHRWQLLCARVKREETRCWICVLKGRIEFASYFVNSPRHPLSKSVDHVIPRSRGGAMFDRRNCRLAHLRCNSDKGTRIITPSVVEPRSEVW